MALPWSGASCVQPLPFERLYAAVRDAIRGLDDDAWTPATRPDGEPRDGAHVAEITDQLDLAGYPDGSRVLVRREPLHPGAQQTLDDIDGKRFTAFLTDQPEVDLATLDTRHRAHARVEDRIRGAKDTGARNLPCDTFERNAVWLQLVLAAQDLTSFMANLCLDGELRVAPNPPGCATSCCTCPPGSWRPADGRSCASSTTGRGRNNC